MKKEKWMKKEKHIVEKQNTKSKLDTYTFFLEHLGGLYISQVKAVSHIDAIPIWIKQLQIKDIPTITELDRKKFIKEEMPNEIEVITPIEGLKFVWCFTIKTKKGIGIVNIIKTKVR